MKEHSMKDRLPRRRITTHVETLHGELCIYEWTTKTVHALNPAAARVWEMCDGRTTIEEMSAMIGRGGDVPRATAIVEHALAKFARAGLLEPASLPHVVPVVSRRALLRRIGVAAAIPVVTSIVAPAPLAAQSGNTRQFNFTGTAQSFDVPAGITSLQVDVVGASGIGPAGIPGLTPGAGGRVQATLPVTPGETLTIMVGGGFFNGAAGNGGGASDIRRGSTRLIVAGGGGGTGGPVGLGGAGGGLVGAAGIGGCAGGSGGGGTQSAGGAGGVPGPGGVAGSPGTLGDGGPGANGLPPSFFAGGGGGGGYFGGGGGAACGDPLGLSGSGGGGSSFTDPSATSVVHTQGYGGLPRIILSW
jgi:hypothetical protein